MILIPIMTLNGAAWTHINMVTLIIPTTMIKTINSITMTHITIQGFMIKTQTIIVSCTMTHTTFIRHPIMTITVVMSGTITTHTNLNVITFLTGFNLGAGDQ